MPLRRDVISIDVAAIAPAGVSKVEATVFTDSSAPHTIVCCLPGGGMSRRYFDLQAEGFGDGYSMAAHLVSAGCAVITLDHPGVGGSDSPKDGYALTPPVVAAVNAHAMQILLDQLRRGTLAGGLAPLGGVPAVGAVTRWERCPRCSSRAGTARTTRSRCSATRATDCGRISTTQNSATPTTPKDAFSISFS